MNQRQAIQQSRPAMIKKNIRGQAQFLQAVTEFAEARVHTLAKYAVDVLASFGLSKNRGKRGNRSLAKLKRDFRLTDVAGNVVKEILA